MLAMDVEQQRRLARRRGVAAADRLAGTIRYYDDHAAAYAASTMAIDTSDAIGRFTRLVPAGGRVLDAGCGSGRDLVQLAEAGLNPVGVDVSVGLAAIARRRSGLPVTVADLRTMDLEASSFDGIWAMASLLHLERRDLSDVLSSMHDALKPGGILFASVKRGVGDAEDDTGRWFTLYGEEEWARHLRDAGFEVIEVLGEPASGATATGTVAPGWISSLARRP